MLCYVANNLRELQTHLLCRQVELRLNFWSKNWQNSGSVELNNENRTIFDVRNPKKPKP